MRGHVAVTGGGVGVLTGAALLARGGCRVTVSEDRSTARPVLVLNEVTQALLDDLWGPDVTAGAHAVTQRRVRWGGAPEAVVPVRAIVIDGGTLVARLRARVPDAGHDQEAPAWIIDGTRPIHRATFGRRCVLQAEVAAGGHEVAITTVAAGWLHVAPVSNSAGVVQAMVPSPPPDPDMALAAMLREAGFAHRPIGPVAVFPAAPAITEPPCRPGWISVADGAVRVDPLSGSGTAWAMRGGILAAAVVEAVDSGLAVEAGLGHYEARLRQALCDHVEQCLSLYGAAFDTPAWREEIGFMTRALADQRRRHPPVDYNLRLNGLHLEPRTFAAR